MAELPTVHRPYQVNAQTMAINQHFYGWDYRLRGYDLYEYPVHPEPIFTPIYQTLIPAAPIVDDGRHETLLSGLIKTVKSSFQSQASQGVSNQDEATQLSEDLLPEILLPDLYVPAGVRIEFQLTLPKDRDYDLGQVASFLQGLKGIQHPVSFELIATEAFLLLQLTCMEADQLLFGSQLSAFFPQVLITKTSEALAEVWANVESEAISIVDFGLADECGLAIKSYDKTNAPDPYVSLIAALETVTKHECAVFQVLLTPVRHDWSSELVNAITDVDGSCIFADAPQLQKDTIDKASSPLFATVVRVACASQSQTALQSLIQRIGGALGQYDSPGKNRLMPLINDYYPDAVHLEDVLQRLTHRTGMLLSLPELVGLVHLPSNQVHSSKLMIDSARTKPCPASVLGHDLLLGENIHHGEVQPVGLSEAQRMRHTYVIGASGTGKSTLLRNLLLQDIAQGEGLALLDPHGDLIDSVLSRIPEHRQQDVILFDAGDAEFPVGFNILHAHSEAEKTLLSSDLTTTFKRLSEAWGDRMHAVLANGIMAMLEHPEGGTLLTLRRFLTDKSFRQSFLARINDTEIRYFWEKEYPLYSGRPEASVLTRLDTFLRPKTIRNMVAQAKSSVDFSAVMDTRKILLVKLSHGAIGEENAHLLGSLIVTAIHQAALRRQAQDQSKRVPFYLYADEFQHFVTPSMESILSGARKYNLGLVLAHQERRQLVSKDREVASSVLSNAYTHICFRLGYEDANALSKGLGFFEAHDLQNLGIGQAIVRTEQAQYDFNLTVSADHGAQTEVDSTEAMIAFSRQHYAKPKAIVEAEIQSLYQQANVVTAVTEPPAKAIDKPIQHSPEKPSAKKEQAASASVEREPLVEKPKVASKVKQLGRGGTQHSYLQNLIKKYAEEHGFKATIEEKVLGGSGFVDVALTLGDEKIACEISVSTESDYEIQNIQKCIAAGFNQVVVMANNAAKLKKLEVLAKETLEAAVLKQVHFLMPEAFLAYLDNLVSKQSKPEKSVRGYKVKSQFVSGNKADQQAKSLAVARLIAKKLGRNNIE